jgi:hypothetical protein
MGCAARQNELRLGDAASLPTIEPFAPPALSETPSLTGVDRSTWPAVTLLAPVDSIDPQVAGALPLSEAGAPHRAARRFPSAEEAVSTGPADSFLSANTIVAPFASGLDLVSLLYRWPARAAWTRDGDRLDWRERAPHERSSSASEPTGAPENP